MLAPLRCRVLQQAIPALRGASVFPVTFAAMLSQAGTDRCLSSGPTTATPPPDAARGATADLCDMFITDPVDTITEREVQIMEPVFRYASHKQSSSNAQLAPPLQSLSPP
jgi:hypothetical protein